MLQKIVLFTVLLMQCIGFAQTKLKKEYTLSESINIALKNNLDLKSTILRANTATINFKQSKTDVLPTLNGNYNIGVNTGRSIDPFTNDFINQELTFSSARLSLDATIFNGFRLLNTIKQQRLNKQASNVEIEEAKQNLVLNVTLTYLQILNNKALLELAEERLKTTKKQYKRQEIYYNQEIGNPADFADIKGQLTRDETTILSSKNALKSTKINLARLLNVKEEIAINPTDLLLGVERYGFSSREVFNEALQNLASFNAKKLRVEAARKGVSVVKSQFAPEITFFGQLNTNYSSAAQTFSAIGTSVEDTGDFVTINNQEIPVQTNQTQFEGHKIGYKDQFDNNLNTVVGVAVNIPLFNGFRTKNNVALEKIKVEEALLVLDRTEQEIKNAIAQVYFDMETAYERYNSLKRQVEAFKESFRVNEIRFNNGASNFLAYITSKNNLDAANTNLINAKYDYLLRIKVLEFYRGNTL